MALGWEEKGIIAVDISDTSVKMIRLERTRKGPVLRGICELNLKEGWVEEGNILRPESVSKVLTKGLEEVPGFKRCRWAVASLPEEKSFFEIISLPKGLKEEEISLAVRAEAEKYIPLSLEEVYLDTELIDEEEGHIHVALGAIPRAIADSYLETLKSAGLEPVFFELETQSIARAVVKGGYSPRPLVILDLGATKTRFIVFSGGQVRFSSSIPFSGGIFAREIAKKLGISIEKAEKIKQEKGLEAEKKVIDIIRPHLENLIGKIKDYMSYYLTHPSHEHKEIVLDTIILCGGFANLKGLPNLLQETLDKRVILANPWINILGEKVALRPPISLSESLRFTTALGLAKLALDLEF